jgi:hypothetical protein
VDRMAKFENALVELIDMHMDGGLTGAEVRLVLKARAEDNFDAGRVIGGPQTEAVKRFGESGA